MTDTWQETREKIHAAIAEIIEPLESQGFRVHAGTSQALDGYWGASVIDDSGPLLILTDREVGPG